MGSADSYWAGRYSEAEAIKHHANQNRTIARDFVSQARMRKPFADALSRPSIIEVGCGTGDMAAHIKQLYNTKVYYATDFSRDAIKVAKSRHPYVNFYLHDVLKDPPPQYFFLCLCGNTLEHFTDPHPVLLKMFDLAVQVMLLVPYAQPVTDGFDAEGGAGHVFTFTEATFETYDVVDMFQFETTGWKYSSAGEKPFQLAVLINSPQ